MSALAIIIIDINVRKVNISACGVFYINVRSMGGTTKWEINQHKKYQ